MVCSDEIMVIYFVSMDRVGINQTSFFFFFLIFWDMLIVNDLALKCWFLLDNLYILTYCLVLSSQGLIIVQLVSLTHFLNEVVGCSKKKLLEVFE